MLFYLFFTNQVFASGSPVGASAYIFIAGYVLFFLLTSIPVSLLSTYIISKLATYFFKKPSKKIFITLFLIHFLIFIILGILWLR